MIRHILATIGLVSMLAGPALAAPAAHRAPTAPHHTRAAKRTHYSHAGCPTKRGYHTSFGAAVRCAERAHVHAVTATAPDGSRHVISW